MPTTTTPFEIPDFFEEQVKALSAGLVKAELELLFGSSCDSELEFYRLGNDCDEYVNSLNDLDRLLVARFMLNELIEKFQD